MVSHPAITFGSNVQFLFGAAVAAAALVGGFLTVLVDFPLVFLILVAAGVFLMTLGGLRLAVPNQTQPENAVKEGSFWTDAMQQGLLQEEEDRKRKLRQSLNLVRGEVQYNLGLIERSTYPRDVSAAQLRVSEWNGRYQELAAEPGFVAAVRTREAAYESFEHRRDFTRSQIEARSKLALEALDSAIQSLAG